MREECDADETYGVAAEQALSKQISDAVVSMGRTRRKVDELKLKAAKDKKRKKEEKEKDRKLAASLETPLDSFDARMETMEKENDRAMSGLDDLLQEMEEEEGLIESMRKEHEDLPGMGMGEGTGPRAPASVRLGGRRRVHRRR